MQQRHACIWQRSPKDEPTYIYKYICTELFFVPHKPLLMYICVGCGQGSSCTILQNRIVDIYFYLFFFFVSALASHLIFVVVFILYVFSTAGDDDDDGQTIYIRERRRRRVRAIHAAWHGAQMPAAASGGLPALLAACRRHRTHTHRETHCMRPF